MANCPWSTQVPHCSKPATCEGFCGHRHGKLSCFWAPISLFILLESACNVLFYSMVNVICSLEFLRVGGGFGTYTFMSNEIAKYTVIWVGKFVWLSTFRPYLNRIARNLRKLRILACLIKFSFRREEEGGEFNLFKLFSFPSNTSEKLWNQR